MTEAWKFWIPASAGMTETTRARCLVIVTRTDDSVNMTGTWYQSCIKYREPRTKDNSLIFLHRTPRLTQDNQGSTRHRPQNRSIRTCISSPLRKGE
jgi:hypothetical protein